MESVLRGKNMMSKKPADIKAGFLVTVITLLDFSKDGYFHKQYIHNKYLKVLYYKRMQKI